MSKQYTLLHADDHPALRMGIAFVVSKMHGFTMIDIPIGDGEYAIKAAEQHKPDIFLLDFDLPKKNGLQVAKHFAEQGTDMKMIILSGFIDRNVYEQGQAVGIQGFLMKISALDELKECLSQIVKGHTYISKNLEEVIGQQADDSHGSDPDVVLSDLTGREKKVLALIVDGKTTAQIADTLCNSQRTIDVHRYNICKKLNLKGQNMLINYVLKHKGYLKHALEE